MLCVYCFSDTFWEILDILIMFMGVPGSIMSENARQVCKIFIVSLDDILRKKKTIMLGKLQKYFLSPLYPRQCLNKKAFCTLALSVMTVRAEMASSASCQNPTLCPPFCPTGTHSHTHCSGLQGARLVAEGYCVTPCL